MKPVRILQLIDSLGYGGAERLLATTLPLFDQKEVLNAVVHVLPADDLKRALQSHGARVHALGLTHRRQLIAGVCRLMRIIKKEQPDIIHTHCWLSNIIGRIAGRLCGVMVVSTLHNADYEEEIFIDNPGYPRWKYRLDKTIDRITTRYAKRYIAVSDHVRQSSCDHLGLDLSRIEVIHNGIDTDFFSPITDAEPTAALKQYYGLNLSGPVLLNVGRLVPQKGHKFMIEAMRQIITVIPEAQLVFVGAGWLQPQLIQVTHAAGLKESIFFITDPRDVREVYACCDVFLFTSLCEGFGIVVCEAMAMEKPVIAFDQPPVTEIITHGQTGFLVKPYDVDALATQTIDVLNDLEQARSIGQAARLCVLERFDIEQTVCAMTAFYAQCKGERRIAS